jgi:hypothetical protein
VQLRRTGRETEHEPASLRPKHLIFRNSSSPAAFSPFFFSAESANSFGKVIVKAAEKVCCKLVWKSCAKHVEKRLIFCGFAVESLCKNLRITCGETVE